VSSRRTVVLIAAIAMGALAAFVLRNYIKDKEAAANPNPVKVWIVSSDIKRGEPFSSARAVIREDSMPVKYVPATFVEDLRSLEGKVASTNLAANQVLVKDMFVSSEIAATGLRDRLGDRMVAIAVPIEGVRAVGGLLQPGDEVNIMVTPTPPEGSGSSDPAKPEDPDAPTVDPAVSPYTKAARYLYQQVRILSIGTSVRPQPGEAIVAQTGNSTTLATSGGSIVFEVPADAAQVFASIDPGAFYLTLIPKNWNIEALPPLNAADLEDGALLPGEDPARLTPYGPTGYTNSQNAGALTAGSGTWGTN
jgi:Flp pilus assembly protein CpaB